jgi:hypothetical protein
MTDLKASPSRTARAAEVSIEFTISHTTPAITAETRVPRVGVKSAEPVSAIVIHRNKRAAMMAGSVRAAWL